ncbi:MAG: molybdopterin dinucleotide binding domain-containing protein, partial [Marmoricola sp.]
ERAALVPGLLDTVVDLCATTGARWAWVPRRAGDRGAVEAGLLPNLLPGGRPVADAAAREDLARAWDVDALPGHEGRDLDAIIRGAASGEVGSLVVGGVEPADLADPALALVALEKAFVVSLELRASAVTERADVVFPVAAVAEKSGSFVTWEGRLRPFVAALDKPHALPDLRVLAGIADELGRPLGLRTVEDARAEMVRLGPWSGARDTGSAGSASSGPPAPVPSRGLVLASWKQLIDDGRMQDGDEALRATARPPVLMVPPGVLEGLGLQEGDVVTLSGPLGSTTLPVAVADDLADDTVWAPASSPDNPVRRLVGPAGCAVSLSVASREMLS